MGDGAGIVLCGGRSSRMGRAKAWLPWRGQPMLVHVVEILRSAVDEVIVVSAPDQLLPEVEARVVADRTEGEGPLAGIAEGLAAARGERAFVTATDAPWISAPLILALLERPGAAAPIVEGRVQPLSAVYPTSAAATAAALLEAGHRRPRDLLDALHFEAIEGPTLPGIEGIRGFNTPEAYLAAACAEDATPARVELLGRARRLAPEPEFETAPGLLADVLAVTGLGQALGDGGTLARPYAVSLEGRSFVRDLGIPIGPGETVIVMDATVGG